MSPPYLTLVHSQATLDANEAETVPPMIRTLRQRLQHSLQATPVTYAATSTCAILALGSLERLRGEAPVAQHPDWFSAADKVLLAALPITVPVCLATDIAGIASYPYRLWRGTSKGTS